MSLLVWFSVVIVGSIAVATTFHVTISHNAAHAVMGTLFCLIVLHLLYMRGSLDRFAPATVETSGDQYWRAGLFYYNRLDPALFVQSRSGPGYTLNFGNIFSWPLAAAIVGDFAFIFFARHHL